MSDDNSRRIVDDLADDSRVLKQARALPDGPLSPDTIAAVRRDFMAYTHKHGVFLGQVAEQIGIDTNDVTDWRHAKLMADAEGITRAVNEWMEADARRRIASRPTAYVETRIAEEMRAIAHTAHTLECMAAIVVPSGAGKTMMLEILTDEMRGTYVYVDERLTAKAFYVLLAESIGIRGRSATVGQLQRNIVAKLKGTHRPIFVDEAQRLHRDMLSALRSIHDQAGVPIIMAGTFEILDRINDQANGAGQLASRCLRYNALSTAFNASDPGGDRASLSRPLFSKAEIKTYFAQMQVRIDPDAFELCWALACLPGFGCLRLVHRIVQLLTRRDRNATITRRGVLQALPLMFADDGLRLATLAQRHSERFRKVG